jgi:hypothetical protein
MTEKQIDDTTLIKNLRGKIKKVEKEQGILQKQLNVLRAALESLESNALRGDSNTLKTRKIKQESSKHSQIVNAVIELSEKKSAPVGINEILEDLEKRDIQLPGKTNKKTRVSGALSRELKDAHPRIKKTGRGFFMKV